MSRALEQQEIEKEKIERVIFFLRDLYLLTKDGYTTVKWTVLSDKHLTSPLVKQVLLARGIVTKAATKNLFYWSSKNIPSWEIAESIYQSTQALIQKEKANKQIVDSFKKKTEGKLIPIVKMPQTISEVFGLSKGKNPVKTKLTKFSSERRIKAIQDLLDYCMTPKSSIEIQKKCKEVTMGVPTLQWLKATGWLKKNELKHWQTTDVKGNFTQDYFEDLKKDLKSNKNLAMSKDLNSNINNFETETLAFVRGVDPNKWYTMSSLFVFMSRAKIPTHVRETIIDERFENSGGKFRLNESKVESASTQTTNELVDLQTEIHDKIFKYLGAGTESSWRLHVKGNLSNENRDKIFNWLVNNGYFEYTKKLLPIGLRVVKTTISLEEVSRMNKDIKTGNPDTLKLAPVDFRFVPDEFTKTTTTKEKHEEIAKENKSIADNLKQQRIEFAKMLFKLGDVKTANEILSKELE